MSSAERLCTATLSRSTKQLAERPWTCSRAGIKVRPLIRSGSFRPTVPAVARAVRFSTRFAFAGALQPLSGSATAATPSLPDSPDARGLTDYFQAPASRRAPDITSCQNKVNMLNYIRYEKRYSCKILSKCQGYLLMR